MIRGDVLDYAEFGAIQLRSVSHNQPKPTVNPQPVI